MGRKWNSSTITNANKSLRLLTVLSIVFAVLAPLATPSVTFAAITRGATASKASNTGGPTLSITAPAVSAGGVLIAQVTAVKLNQAQLICPPANSGWTSIRRTTSKDTGESDIVQQTFYRVATSALAEASTTWSFKQNDCTTGSALDRAASGGIIAYSGIDTRSPILVSGGTTGTSSDTPRAPAVNSAVANTQVVRFFGIFKNTELSNTAASRVYWEGSSSSAERAVAAFDAAQAATGSTGTFDATPGSSGNAVWVAQTVVLQQNPDTDPPIVTPTLNPLPNAAGWNNSDVTITWTATDAGSGIDLNCPPAANTVPNPNPCTDTVSEGTSGVTKKASAKDRLGNTGTGEVTVRLDKVAPGITGSRSPAANANGWNNSDVAVTFTCVDGLSTVKSCTGATTLSANAAGQSVTGTAVDRADNSASATVSGISIDKVAPTISGKVVDENGQDRSANAAGWFNGDVRIRWTPADVLSGVASVPADSVITGEGPNLTASASVSDRAGNTASATSPVVKIDRTAPATSASAPQGWNNSSVVVEFTTAADLSGVAATRFSVDGGADQTGTSLTLTAEGDHTISYYSVDNAGNVENAKTVQVKIDKTPPTINGSGKTADGADYTAGAWTKQDVVVTFTCGDQSNLSGVRSCVADETNPASPSRTVSSDGAAQDVTGTATDNANNTATGHFSVSIDKTAPTIEAAADRAANENEWYNADVTVTFTCNDTLSGIAITGGCTAPTTLEEGANQSASGTATDAAGNSASGSVTGINVDKTAPTLTGAATTQPNGNGWYKGDVVVDWTCGDNLSGLVGECPADNTITGSGAALAASASVSDRAGNTTDRTVNGIKIDRGAPSTSASVPRVPSTGWYAGAVQVTLESIDELSGVAAIYYSVDGDPQQTYTQPFSHNMPGTSTITFWAVDNAGNVENWELPGHTITIKIDNLPPTIDGSRDPEANSFGWNNDSVTVSFVCRDAETEIESCLGGKTLTDEGENQSVTGTAKDVAGNQATAKVEKINIDLTAPSLSGAPTVAANAAGWHKGDVTIAWTGTDDLSGIDPATQPGNDVITGEGTNLGAGPVSISDKAGNATNASVTGIKIDRTAPTIGGSRSPAANANGWSNTNVTVTFTCADPAPEEGVTASGVEECSDPTILDEDGADQSVTGTATDIAGNSDTAVVGDIDIDMTDPSLVGEPANTNLGNNGWYRGDVTIEWIATDALSGIDPETAPDNSVITGEGEDRTASASVSDNAGNTTSATSPVVKIDRAAPTTTATAPSAWTNAGVTVRLNATDNLSGVGATVFKINGGATQAYNSEAGIPFTAEGVYTLEFWSVDNAGNEEAHTSVQVKIDRTAPTISAASTTADRAAYTSGAWTNQNVSVTFTCADPAGEDGAEASGIESCGPNRTVTTEGKDQAVTGTATDNAGNTSTPLTVKASIDKTRPTISGAPDREPNEKDWYNEGVTVSFTCGDLLSGVASCADPVELTDDGADQSASGTATDAAGNSASDSVPGINVDQTDPTLTGAATTQPNANGWYNANVTIRWTPADALSGIDTTTVPADSVISSEGDNGSESASVKDNAGNTGNGNVTSIKIDRTPPTSTAPELTGWSNGPVTVKLQLSDNLSGVQSTSFKVDNGAVQVYNAENGIVVGTNGVHTITFWSLDKAGNVETEKVATVQIDTSAPTISGSRSPAANAHGWNNADVTVTFTCADPAPAEGVTSSGIKECNGATTLGSDGANQSVEGTAVDNAGNSATATVDRINIDKTAPTIEGTAANTNLGSNGWYRGDVTITWTGTDTLSGIDPATQPGPSVISGEGNNLGAGPVSISDKAGNVGSASVSGIKIDRAAPTTTADVPAAPASGWYTSAVNVTLTGSDNLSGVDKTFYSLDGGDATEYAAPISVSGDGTHTVQFWSVDKAGNGENRTASGNTITIKIDATGPAITINGVVGGSTYTLGAVPAASCTATDATSGIAVACSGRVSGGTANGTGLLTYTATATDNAGNTTTVLVSYRVIYSWGGFLQPINDTAHQVGTSTSIFKAGSTVPAKFQLKNAAGQVVQASSLPQWLTPVKGSATSAAVDEALYSDPASSGDRYSWNGQQYQYNWKTASNQIGYYWRIGVVLDDGQRYYVNIGLR